MVNRLKPLNDIEENTTDTKINKIIRLNEFNFIYKNY
jgi:hypothetical protein